MDASRLSRADCAELRLTRQPLAASAAPLKMCAAAVLTSLACAWLTALSPQQEHPVWPDEQPGGAAGGSVPRV